MRVKQVRSHPGYITLAAQTPLYRIRRVAAPDAGHLYGLGDAYAAWYRFFSAAPGTSVRVKSGAHVCPISPAPRPWPL